MKKIALATLMAISTVGAYAAQPYVEGAFGMANFNVDCEGSTSCEPNGVGMKLVGGVTIVPHLAVEVGYINFGTAKISGLNPQMILMDAKLKSTAMFGAAALRAELAKDLTGVARLGLALVDTKIDYSALSGAYTSSNKASEAKAIFGLGLEYAIQKNLKITGAIDLTNSAKSDEILDDGALRLISVGAQYSF